jgi:uncharacterized protein (DUF1800 family)
LPAPATEASDDEAAIVHALNRLGYGPRPGDIERVRAVGLRQWIEDQLQPDRIVERGLEKRLAPLTTLRLSTAEIFEGYSPPREARAEMKQVRAELGGDASEEEMAEARRQFMDKHADDMEGPPKQVLDELQAAKLIRAVHAERQLDEVLVDFWMNHFNVYAAKGADRYMITAYERDVIRPRAWGRFHDLLRATAESPALLFYLDNWLSAGPKAAASKSKGPQTHGDPNMRVPGMFKPVKRYGTEAKKRREPPDEAPRRGGLNENYARELLEQHTLGASGGYAQKDVREVARCFTGWTIDGLHDGQPRFVFDDSMHDKGEKVVLGKKVKGDDKEEGERVLRLLAEHPSTARSIATKLVRRFVSDTPPPALVKRATEAFLVTDGEIRAVVRTIVESPEFQSPEARGAKVKSPLEFAASAVRAIGADVEDGRDLARRVAAMGMPLYMIDGPAGYRDTADAWSTPRGSPRWDFALDLAAGKLAGVRVDPAALAAPVVPFSLSEATRALLDEEHADESPARRAGLLLASPEFQRK